MANQRIFIKCDVCGELFMLGKRMAIGYYRAPSSEGLNGFYDAHDECAEDGGPDPFSVEYEIDREFYLDEPRPSRPWPPALKK